LSCNGNTLEAEGGRRVPGLEGRTVSVSVDAHPVAEVASHLGEILAESFLGVVARTISGDPLAGAVELSVVITNEEVGSTES
jgi:hypothetical protein